MTDENILETSLEDSREYFLHETFAKSNLAGPVGPWPRLDRTATPIGRPPTITVHLEREAG